MTDRLDRIEATLERTIKVVESNARAIEANRNAFSEVNDTLDRTEKIVESNARAIEANSNAISELKSGMDAAFRNIGAMQDLAVHLETSQIKAQERHDAQMEHLGRLLDLLVTRATPN
jgi:methyl-accepting chemotaxis protein